MALNAKLMKRRILEADKENEQLEAEVAALRQLLQEFVELDTIYDLHQPDGSPDPVVVRLLRRAKSELAIEAAQEKKEEGARG